MASLLVEGYKLWKWVSSLILKSGFSYYGLGLHHSDQFSTCVCRSWVFIHCWKMLIFVKRHSWLRFMAGWLVVDYHLWLRVSSIRPSLFCTCVFHAGVGFSFTVGFLPNGIHSTDSFALLRPIICDLQFCTNACWSRESVCFQSCLPILNPFHPDRKTIFPGFSKNFSLFFNF